MNPIEEIEILELLDKLRANGYAEIVEALLAQECWKKKSQTINKSKLAAKVKMAPSTLQQRLEEMAIILREKNPDGTI